MKIQILHLLEGAKQAEGTVVIIDVFRAFSFEAYLYEAGAAKVIPVETVAEAFAYKQEHPEYILAGERDGKIVDGFDIGNTPCGIAGIDVKNKVIVHTTSAGVQGVVNAVHADEILTGALVNAEATAAYIKKKNPACVSLVCMGLAAAKRTQEDILCAEYIASLLHGQPLPDIEQRTSDLRYTDGKKFFDPLQKDVFPPADFDMCTKINCLNFAVRVAKRENHLETEQIFL